MNQLIILAAGHGKRMGINYPKCFVKVLGKSFLEYLLDMAKETSLKPLCIVRNKEFFNNLDCVLQQEYEGTAAAVLACLKNLETEGYSVIVNGDSIFDPLEVKKMIFEFEKNQCAMTVGVTTVKNPIGLGRIVTDGNRLISIIEEQEATANIKKINIVNTGLIVVKNSFLKENLPKLFSKEKKEYYLTDLVKMTEAKIFELKVFYTANNSLQLVNITEEIRKKIILKHLENGVFFESTESVTIGPDVLIESGATIRFGSQIYGKSAIAKAAVIGPYSYLLNSVVCEGSEVIMSYINDTKIGIESTIGPFAHLRSKADIGNYNRIGNFVEIKNSKTGTATKLSHLSYMGDTSCGSHVNFGCGAITVNYDGNLKNKTVIGDGAFIGCNSNLVAPIKLAEKSYVAAGSTITEDLEENDFAIARSHQITKPRYAVKYFKEEEK